MHFHTCHLLCAIIPHLAFFVLAGVPLVEPMQESAMKLDSEEAAYEDIAAIIEDLEGVLEHGMLLDVVTEAVVVGIDGPVTLTKVSSGA